jgi:replicative DNA helicase
MRIIDYGCLMPGSKRKLTAEDRECIKKVTAKLSAIAKEQNVVFVIAKHRSGPPPSMMFQWVNPVGDDLT